jgi:hypothetical protein
MKNQLKLHNWYAKILHDCSKKLYNSQLGELYMTINWGNADREMAELFINAQIICYHLCVCFLKEGRHYIKTTIANIKMDTASIRREIIVFITMDLVIAI